MCRGRDMNVLVMDVEGTDGRERGEDQVCLLISGISSHLTVPPRISNANQLYSPSRRRRFSLLTFGSTKSVCIKVPTWGFLRPSSKLILGFLGRSHKKREFFLPQPQWRPLISHVSVRANARFSYLLFAITLERRPLRTSRQH